MMTHHSPICCAKLLYIFSYYYISGRSPVPLPGICSSHLLWTVHLDSVYPLLLVLHIKISAHLCLANEDIHLVIGH